MADRRAAAAHAMLQLAATPGADTAQIRSEGIAEVAAGALALHFTMRTKPPPRTPQRERELMTGMIVQTPYKHDPPIITREMRNIVSTEIAQVLNPRPAYLAATEGDKSKVADKFVDWLATKAVQQSNPPLFFLDVGNWEVQWDIYQRELRSMAASSPGGSGGAGAGSSYMLTVEFA